MDTIFHITVTTLKWIITNQKQSSADTKIMSSISPVKSLSIGLPMSNEIALQKKSEPLDLFEAASSQSERKPKFHERMYYRLVLGFNQLRSYLPGFAHFAPASHIPCPQGLDLHGCSLNLGMQPGDKLAQQIGAHAYVISILEPFEAKHTSKKLKNVHLIRSQDNKPVAPENIEAGVQEIEKAVALGNQFIYVHCKSGKGRSATVLAAYLVKHAHMTPQEAGDYLHKYRRETVLNKKGHYHQKALQAWNLLRTNRGDKI